MKEGASLRAGPYIKRRSGEEDLGFGFDDEEGVGVVMALGAEFLDGFV